MDNLLSQKEKLEVENLRFDRVKIQRKRMEHILEVIKDLTFKNQELTKQNYMLREGGQSHYKQLFEELSQECEILIQKNISLNSQLQKYKNTVVHQETLINSLKKQLYGHENLPNQQQFTQSWEQSRFNNKDIQLRDNALIMQEHMILKAQYDDLQHEFSQLYKHLYRSGQQNQKYRGSVKNINKHEITNNFASTFDHSNHQSQNYTRNQSNKQNKKQGGFREIYQPVKNSRSNKSIKNIGIQVLSNEQMPSDLKFSKLKSKYQKTKDGKKQLTKIVKSLQHELNQYKEKTTQQNMLVSSMIHSKSTLCKCHIKKLQKHLTHQIIQSQTKLMDTLTVPK